MAEIREDSAATRSRPTPMADRIVRFWYFKRYWSERLRR